MPKINNKKKDGKRIFDACVNRRNDFHTFPFIKVLMLFAKDQSRKKSGLVTIRTIVFFLFCSNVICDQFNGIIDLFVFLYMLFTLIHIHSGHTHTPKNKHANTVNTYTPLSHGRMLPDEQSAYKNQIQFDRFERRFYCFYFLAIISRVYGKYAYFIQMSQPNQNYYHTTIYVIHNS